MRTLMVGKFHGVCRSPNNFLLTCVSYWIGECQLKSVSTAVSNCTRLESDVNVNVVVFVQFNRLRAVAQTLCRKRASRSDSADRHFPWGTVRMSRRLVVSLSRCLILSTTSCETSGLLSHLRTLIDPVAGVRGRGPVCTPRSGVGQYIAIKYMYST